MCEKGVTMANVQLREVAGKTHAKALNEIGILTVSQLLETGATSGGRMKIADTTNIDLDAVLRYVHVSDLLRIDGVSADMASALCEAGVVTVPKLAYRSADSIKEELTRHDSDKEPSTTKDFERIIAAAKKLPKVVQH